MTNLNLPIRSEVLNKLRYNLSHTAMDEQVYADLINDLANKLILVNNPNERKILIKSWYNDLEGAKNINRHSLSFQNPEQTKQLKIALNNLSIRYKKRFYNYFS